MAEKTAAIDGMTINYYEGPQNGVPLVMLHGVTGRWQSFEQLIPFMTPYYHVFAPDARGHGKSDHVPGRYAMEYMAADTAGFVKEVIGKPAAILGHSMGGRVALETAIRHPDQASALVVIDSPLTPLSSKGGTTEAFLDVFGRWAELKEKNLPLHEFASALGDLPARPLADGTPQHYRDFWNHADLLYTARCLQLVDVEIPRNLSSSDRQEDYNLLGKLSEIRCPVLFLQGDPKYGALLDQEDLQKALSVMDDAYAVRIDGTGHGVHTDMPVRTAQCVHNFLAAYFS